MPGGRILVTGAAGLVGAVVARRLLERGDEVIAIDRHAGRVLPEVQVQACDVGDVHRLHALARGGLDGVVHCGAFSGPMVARDDPYAMIQVNIVGTANVLELARIHGARRFVFCSSTSAYGHTPEGLIDEQERLRPESLYGTSKVVSELLVERYDRQYGLSGVSVRLSWVYGPRRSTDCVIRAMLQDAQAGRPTRLPFGRDFHRQFVHVEDAAAALLAAMDAKSPGQPAYNVTGDSYLTLEQVAQVVRRVHPQADIVLQSGPDPLDEVQHRFDISAARRDLGYQPGFSLEDGIRGYSQWLAQASTAVGG